MDDGVPEEFLEPFQVFWPSGLSGGMTLILLAVVWVLYSKPIVEWFSVSNQRTLGFRFIFLVLPTVVLTVLGDLIDFSGVIDGKGVIRDQVLFVIFVPLGLVWLASQAFDQRLSNDWQTQLAAANEELDQALRGKAKAEEQRNFPIRLGRIMLRIVGFKGRRVRKVLPERDRVQGAEQHLETIRKAFDPTAQILETVMGIHRYVLDLAGVDCDGHPYSVRVALFAERGDYLEPTVSFDGTSEDVINAPLGVHRDRFCVAPSYDKMCAASVALRSFKTIMIPNADAANEDAAAPFAHFDDQQKTQIKSLVAMPLYRGDRHDRCAYVLSIDTNREGFFGSQGIDERQLDVLRENLEQRILFEEDVKLLLTPLG